jgi:hypothetical protein
MTHLLPRQTTCPSLKQIMVTKLKSGLFEPQNPNFNMFSPNSKKKQNSLKTSITPFLIP